MTLATDNMPTVCTILQMISQRAMITGDNIIRAHAEHAIELLKKDIEAELSVLLMEQAS